MSPDNALLIWAIMDVLPIDIDNIIVQRIQEVVIGDIKSLYFPSSITYVCQNDGVDKK